MWVRKWRSNQFAQKSTCAVVLCNFRRFGTLEPFALSFIATLLSEIRTDSLHASLIFKTVPEATYKASGKHVMVETVLGRKAKEHCYKPQSLGKLEVFDGTEATWCDLRVVFR
eukprot:2208523-Amphidinium_carterae.1